MSFTDKSTIIQFLKSEEKSLQLMGLNELLNVLTLQHQQEEYFTEGFHYYYEMLLTMLEGVVVVVVEEEEEEVVDEDFLVLIYKCLLQLLELFSTSDSTKDLSQLLNNLVDVIDFIFSIEIMELIVEILFYCDDSNASVELLLLRLLERIDFFSEGKQQRIYKLLNHHLLSRSNSAGNRIQQELKQLLSSRRLELLESRELLVIEVIAKCRLEIPKEYLMEISKELETLLYQREEYSLVYYYIQILLNNNNNNNNNNSYFDSSFDFIRTPSCSTNNVVELEYHLLYFEQMILSSNDDSSDSTDSSDSSVKDGMVDWFLCLSRREQKKILNMLLLKDSSSNVLKSFESVVMTHLLYSSDSSVDLDLDLEEYIQLVHRVFGHLWKSITEKYQLQGFNVVEDGFRRDDLEIFSVPSIKSDKRLDYNLLLKDAISHGKRKRVQLKCIKKKTVKNDSNSNSNSNNGNGNGKYTLNSFLSTKLWYYLSIVDRKHPRFSTQQSGSSSSSSRRRSRYDSSVVYNVEEQEGDEEGSSTSAVVPVSANSDKVTDLILCLKSSAGKDGDKTLVRLDTIRTLASNDESNLCWWDLTLLEVLYEFDLLDQREIELYYGTIDDFEKVDKEEEEEVGEDEMEVDDNDTETKKEEEAEFKIVEWNRRKNHFDVVYDVPIAVGQSMDFGNDDDDDDRNLSEFESKILLQAKRARMRRCLVVMVNDLLLASYGCVPSWFLKDMYQKDQVLPVELRYAYLELRYFGLARFMQRHQKLSATTFPSNNNNNTSSNGRGGSNNNPPTTSYHELLQLLNYSATSAQNSFLPRFFTQKQKFRISRDSLVPASMKVLKQHDPQLVLEIEFYNEVGTGLGPTLEFYSLLCKELQQCEQSYKTRSSLNEKDSNSFTVNVFTKCSNQYLFPLQLKKRRDEKFLRQYFEFLGRFIAKSLLDNRLIDLPLHPLFLHMCLSQDNNETKNLSLDDRFSVLKMHQIDSDFVNSLDKLRSVKTNEEVQAMGLSFSSDGDGDIGEGKDIETLEQLHEFISSSINSYFDLELQVSSFKQGFNDVFNFNAMKMFTPTEFQSFITGTLDAFQNWSLDSLKESIKFDHGYSVHSRLARDFLDVLLEFTVQQRQKFIMFVTGSKLLPAKNGLKALEPPLTVVRKTVDQSNSVETDLHLPSVMTCVNYLKIPEYSSKDVLERQLLYAINEGQQSFHLS